MKTFEIYNETKEQLDKEITNIKKVLDQAIKQEHQKDIYFNVIIVDNKYIQELNKTYRNIDNPTDVITFALEDEKEENYTNTKTRILGDIYISIDKATEQKKLYQHSLDRELCFLAVHGFLHLLGYDHIKKEEEEIMFEKQELILNEAGITR